MVLGEVAAICTREAGFDEVRRLTAVMISDGVASLRRVFPNSQELLIWEKAEQRAWRLIPDVLNGEQIEVPFYERVLLRALLGRVYRRARQEAKQCSSDCSRR